MPAPVISATLPSNRTHPHECPCRIVGPLCGAARPIATHHRVPNLWPQDTDFVQRSKSPGQAGQAAVLIRLAADEAALLIEVQEEGSTQGHILQRLHPANPLGTASLRLRSILASQARIHYLCNRTSHRGLAIVVPFIR